MVSSQRWKMGRVASSGFAKQLLHHPQLLVLQCHLGGSEVGVGAQHPLAVVARFAAHRLLVDDEALALAREVLAVAAVADERLVALLELLAQRRQDDRTVRLVLALLGLVETDHIAAALDVHLLDPQGGRVLGVGTGWMDHVIAAGSGQDLLAHLLVPAHPRPPRAWGWLIMPRSATTHSSPMAKRLRSRSTMGTRESDIAGIA